MDHKTGILFDDFGTAKLGTKVKIIGEGYDYYVVKIRGKAVYIFKNIIDLRQ